MHKIYNIDKSKIPLHQQFRNVSVSVTNQK